MKKQLKIGNFSGIYKNSSGKIELEPRVILATLRTTCYVFKNGGFLVSSLNLIDFFLE